MSKIQWTGKTWNVVTGCTKVSAGCERCYAEKMSVRLEAMGSPKYRGITKDGRWTGTVRCHPKMLDKVPSAKMVFVCSMSDTFHEEVPDDFLDKLFAVMALHPKQTFQLLTKRPKRALAYLKSSHYRAEMVGIEAEYRGGLDRYTENLKPTWPFPLPNLWLGVSVEGPEHKHRIDTLRQTPAAVRFISFEPLLADLGVIDFTGIHQAILGGESGPGARPMHPDWVRSVCDQCVAAGVPFFFKQWGEWAPWDHRSSTMGYLKQEHNHRSVRVGKKAAGRELDGRVWDQMPAKDGQEE